MSKCSCRVADSPCMLPSLMRRHKCHRRPMRICAVVMLRRAADWPCTLPALIVVVGPPIGHLRCVPSFVDIFVIVVLTKKNCNGHGTEAGTGAQKRAGTGWDGLGQDFRPDWTEQDGGWEGVCTSLRVAWDDGVNISSWKRDCGGTGAR